MEYDLILVRYGELSLKSKYVRNYFERTLIKNISDALKVKKIEFKIVRKFGRIIVFTNEISKSVKIVKKIFGITSISPAKQTESNIDSISKLSINSLKKKLTKEKSFALRVTRTGDHNFSSQEVAINVGQDIVDHFKSKVDLKKPDVKLFIEIRDKNSYIFTDKIKGVGGLPLATQGTVLALIDSNESILASWYLMHRGCNTIFLVQNKSLIEKLNLFSQNWSIEPKIIIFEKDNIYKNLISRYKINAIVTGNYLSDGPNDIFKIKEMKEKTNLPILSPLISMSKKEIKSKIEEMLS